MYSTVDIHGLATSHIHTQHYCMYCSVRQVTIYTLPLSLSERSANYLLFTILMKKRKKFALGLEGIK